MKPKFKFKPKARLRVGVLPIAAKGVRWRSMKVRSGRAFRVKSKRGAV
jgi:hypothetical protein